MDSVRNAFLRKHHPGLMDKEEYSYLFISVQVFGLIL